MDLVINRPQFDVNAIRVGSAVRIHNTPKLYQKKIFNHDSFDHNCIIVEVTKLQMKVGYHDAKSEDRYIEYKTFDVEDFSDGLYEMTELVAPCIPNMMVEHK